MQLYIILGITSGATDEDIKKAYRYLSKIHHPDKGGDAEVFKQIGIAYQILSDPEKRKRYDSGESVDSVSKAGVSIETHILRQLVELFTQVVLNTDPQYTNIVEHMKRHLNNNLNQINQTIAVELNKVARLETVINRIKRTEGENIFIGSAQGQIANIKLAIANMENNKTYNERAIKMLEDYSYEADPNPNVQQWVQWSTTSI